MIIIKYDYLKTLECQCDVILQKRDSKESISAFGVICKNLSRDFLPPIAREDLAAISYSLVDVSVKSKDIVFSDEIKKQINSLKPLLNSLFSKNKTCGDEIRRLIEININYNNSEKNIVMLNKTLSDFYKSVLLAYYGNL